MAIRHNPPIKWHCPVCGIRVTVRLFPVHCRCGYTQYEHPAGLGDRAAAVLARCGITTQRYRKAKQTVGLRGDCGCGKRQRGMNSAGKRIGI